jgi:hypothetical protein
MKGFWTLKHYSLDNPARYRLDRKFFFFNYLVISFEIIFFVNGAM